MGIAPPCPLIDRAMMLILWEESRCGGDPRSRPGVIGPAGERGPWQITPVFERECIRLGWGAPPVHDLPGCVPYVRAWLLHHGRDCKTAWDYRELYRRGPTGYAHWRGIAKHYQ